MFGKDSKRKIRAQFKMSCRSLGESCTTYCRDKWNSLYIGLGKIIISMAVPSRHQALKLKHSEGFQAFH